MRTELHPSALQSACFEFEFSTKKTLRLVSPHVSPAWRSGCRMLARRGQRLGTAAIWHVEMISAANVSSHALQDRNCMCESCKSRSWKSRLRLLHVVFASGLCWSKRKKCLLSISCGSNSFWIGVLCLKQRLAILNASSTFTQCILSDTKCIFERS